MTAIGAVVAGTMGLAAIPVASAAPKARASDSGNAGTCVLGNGSGSIKHVIYLQFDNVHLRRDNPNVPSDLEQMPHLLNFLKGNGTVLNKQYTVLISHTAAGMTSSLTGLYPDRMGLTVSNSYDYYNSAGVPSFTSGFKYWTAPVAAGVDNHPNMVNGDSGQPKNTPAPWVTYTRAGCDVGDVSMANTVLENANAAKFAAGPTDLTAPAPAQSTVLSVFSTRGFTVGEQVTLDQDANQETATIASVDFQNRKLNLAAPLQHDHAAGVQVWAPPVTPDPTGDLTNAFGAGTAPWQEGVDSQQAPFGSARANKSTTDFVGIAVHCAQTSSSVCANNSDAFPDKLPDEPHGYNGYQALFGAKFVDPSITNGSPAVNDINGQPITDSFGQPGFPGFDAMPASTTLGYIAQMQEAGIPVTYGYISDTHDDHTGQCDGGGGAFGPGEGVPAGSQPGCLGYEAQLKSYDDAFGKFFDRLQRDGITQRNTLFVVTSDENDNFAGQQAQACDGVTTPCQYAHGQFDLTNGGQSVSSWTGPSTWPPTAAGGLPLVGEVGYNINYLLGKTLTNKTPFDISFDSAPSFYIDGQPQAVDGSGNVLSPPNQTLRDFEHAAANLQAFNPYVNSNGLSPVARYLVDGPTLKALHMINADPQRTMSFTMFSEPSYFFETFSPCTRPSQGCVNSGFAWIHGDYANQIGQTWLGVVGPGVRDGGVDNHTWTDHTDIVPTVNALLGLHADYTPDGRVITEILRQQDGQGEDAWPGQSSQLLGAVYKQLDAPYGAFNHELVVASTNGIKADDATYISTERAIQSLTTARDALVAQIRDVLNGGGHDQGDNEQLIRRGFELFGRAAALAR
jgi:hypothetical protein